MHIDPFDFQEDLKNKMQSVLDDLNKQSIYLKSITDNTQFFQKILDLQNSSFFQRAMEDVVRSQELYAKYLQRERMEREALLSSGWWLPPSIMNERADLIDDAIERQYLGETEALTDLFILVYQSNNSEKIKETFGLWKNNKLFLPWIEAINQAVEAHIELKFYLSVPVFLLIAEGIVSEYCQRKNISTDKIESRGGEKIKVALLHSNSSIKVKDFEYLEQALDGQIFENTKNLSNLLIDDILNRNAVMHGKKPNYGTLKSSLQAFMILDTLNESLK